MSKPVGATCQECGKQFYAGDGLWDNGDYMCGECLARHISKARAKDEAKHKKKGDEK